MMTFGNDETYELLGRAIKTKSKEDYNTFFKIVCDDAMAIINKHFGHLKPQDKEDLMQETAKKMFKNLSSFYNTASDYLPIQRNSYLKEMVVNLARTQFRKASKRSAEVSYDDALSHSDDPDRFDRAVSPEETLCKREAICQAVRFLSEQETGLENRLSVIIGACWKKGRNGSPSDICSVFNGKPMRKVFEFAESLLKKQICEFPEDVLARLKESVDAEPDRPFCSEPGKLRKGTYNLTKKIKESMGNE